MPLLFDSEGDDRFRNLDRREVASTKSNLNVYTYSIQHHQSLHHLVLIEIESVFRTTKMA